MPGRKYRNVTTVVDRSREPGKAPAVFGIGSAPARPAIAVPAAWPVSTETALRTASAWALDVRPRAARWTTATCASRGSPKILVAVTSVWTAAAVEGTRLAAPPD